MTKTNHLHKRLLSALLALALTLTLLPAVSVSAQAATPDYENYMELNVAAPGDENAVQVALNNLGIQLDAITAITVTGTPLELNGFAKLAEKLTALEVLYMPEQRGLPNVTSGQSPFYNHPTLQTLDMPVATSIGNYFFERCTSLQSINLPLAERVGTEAFKDCTGLQGTVELPAATELYGLAFAACSNLTGISLPEVEKIENHCFANCTSLESVHIPKVTNIEIAAFSGCESLTSISLPELTVLTEKVFADCIRLEHVDAPAAAEIQSESFENCTGLINVSFPAVTKIKVNTFAGCTSLQSVDLPLVEEIYKQGFAGCTSLVSVSFPAATLIDESAFAGCTSLRSVNLPAVETIGDSAFLNCTALEGIVLPDMLNSVGRSAFQGTRLKNIVFLKDSPPSFEVTVPHGIFGLTDTSPGNSVQVWVPNDNVVTDYQEHLLNTHIAAGAQVKAFAATDLDQTVALDETSLALTEGEDETLTATVTPDTLGTAVFWKSSAPAVATVDQTGKVTAVSAGTATITAASVLNQTVTANCAVTVSEPPRAPGKPQNLSATEGSGHVTVTWEAPADPGNSAITRYDVSTDGIDWINAGDETTRSHTFTDLVNGVEYTFRVRAVNSSGGGAIASVTATPKSSGGSSGGSTTTYTIRFESNGGSNVANQSIRRSGKVSEPTAPTRNGCEFTGWHTDSALTTKYDFDKAVTSSFTLYAGWKEITDEPAAYEHEAYIQGYSDGTFRPENNLSRAEAAILIYNIASKDGKARLDLFGLFDDVADGHWAYTAIGNLSGWGIINGDSSRSFRPDETITRAEFVTMALRYAALEQGMAATNFDDVPNAHWAAGYIRAAVSYGYVSGYPDGTFKPEYSITRAEAVTILNRVIGCDGLRDGAAFTDVPATHWAHAAITAAATEHDHK